MHKSLKINILSGIILLSTHSSGGQTPLAPDSLAVPGYLAYDARHLNAVSARYGGRIERLYVLIFSISGTLNG